jgi:hypothetical protein
MKNSAARGWLFTTGAAGWIRLGKRLLQGAQIRPQGRVQVLVHESLERLQILASFMASVHRRYQRHETTARNPARHKTRRGSQRSRSRH